MPLGCASACTRIMVYNNTFQPSFCARMALPHLFNVRSVRFAAHNSARPRFRVCAISHRVLVSFRRFAHGFMLVCPGRSISFLMVCAHWFTNIARLVHAALVLVCWTVLPRFAAHNTVATFVQDTPHHLPPFWFATFAARERCAGYGTLHLYRAYARGRAVAATFCAPNIRYFAYTRRLPLSRVLKRGSCISWFNHRLRACLLTTPPALPRHAFRRLVVRGLVAVHERSAYRGNAFTRTVALAAPLTSCAYRYASRAAAMVLPLPLSRFAHRFHRAHCGSHAHFARTSYHGCCTLWICAALVTSRIIFWLHTARVYTVCDLFLPRRITHGSSGCRLHARNAHYSRAVARSAFGWVAAVADRLG